MEESSERRRERLRALREEASLANNQEERRGGSSLGTSGDPTSLPLPGDLEQISSSASPPRRFEFYTDPLAAFSGSQKKKPKSSLCSPLSGAPAPSPLCKSPPSPFWQSKFNPNSRPPGIVNSSGLPNFYPNLHSPGSFSTPQPNPNPNHNPNPYQCKTGIFLNPNEPYSPNQSSTSGRYNSPGSLSTQGLSDFNSNITPQSGFNNPSSSSSLNPLSGFGSPQPLSASQMYSGTGQGSLNVPAINQYSQGRGGFSTDFSPQHRSGGANAGWSQNGMNGGPSHDSSCSRGSVKQSPGRFLQSPGSSGKGNQTPGWSGSKGPQRASHEASARTNPELFVKRSMLSDPWKDLIPVRYDSVASRLDACSVTGSRDWLPKSVSKGIVYQGTKGVSITASGPSLAESLAASYADVVVGEDVA